MVVIGGRRGRRRAAVVPDELSLTMWGVEPSARGLETTDDLSRVRVLLVAEPLPELIAPALSQLEAEMAPDVEIDRAHVELLTRVDGGGGEPGDHQRHGHAEHDEARDHGEHGAHDHGDMMAIVGEPSADGLVMEPIRFELGPLASGLPGGVVVDVELDGDVVAGCSVRALLSPGDVGDPLAPEASRMARRGGERTWEMIAAVEVERALSHAAWLRSFARLLGWQALVEDAGGLVAAISAARRSLAAPADATDAIRTARRIAEELADGLCASRRLRLRTAACGRTDPSDRLVGPTGRAAGQSRDARLDDDGYRELGFEPVIEEGADAYTRTLVRLLEIPQALDLSLAALARGGGTLAGIAQVEGPRGQLVAQHPWAPGAPALLDAAGRASIGLEWASALVAIASFDLSPWWSAR